MKIALLNAPIITVAPAGRLALYLAEEIGVGLAKMVADVCGIESYVGHQSTADVFSLLLDRPVEVSRERYEQPKRGMAIALQLSRRLEEGQVLASVDDVERIGYRLIRISRGI